jgi:hypothetical protein
VDSVRGLSARAMVGVPLCASRYLHGARQSDALASSGKTFGAGTRIERILTRRGRAIIRKRFCRLAGGRRLGMATNGGNGQR